MQISTIKFSQIEDRIDAEYYKPDVMMAIQAVQKWGKNCKILRDYIEIIRMGCSIPSQLYSKSGLPFILGKNLKADHLELGDLEYISPEVNKKYKSSVVKEDDILFSVRGAYLGKVAVVPSELERANIINNIVFIRLKIINPYYVQIYLASKIGQFIVGRKIWGSAQPGITNEDIRNIEIPIPSQSFQQKIEKMVKGAQKKRKLANEKYNEAEEILNKALGLKDLDLSTQKTFEAKFSEAEDRFDPEYYQPRYKKIISKLKSQNSKPLNEIVKINDKELDPTKNPSAEIKYVELANINGSNGIIEDCENYKHWQLPGRARMLIRNSDVLVSSLGGSIDKVGLVTEEYDGQIASTGFFVVNSNVLNSETLFLIFRNKIISGQLERNTRGAIMSAISGNEFKNILIPIISKLTQQKISSLIQESFKLHKEAEELIDRAKKEVEEMVENK